MDVPAPPEPRFVAAAQGLSSAVGDALNPQFLAEEEPAVRQLCDLARLPQAQRAAVQARALQLVLGVRAARGRGGGLDALLQQYHLASAEGVVLMCLAEALLRIPDALTADRLIADKLVRRRLGTAPGRQRFAAGQCLDLGTDAHRATGRAGPGRSRLIAWLVRTPGRACE